MQIYSRKRNREGNLIDPFLTPQKNKMDFDMTQSGAAIPVSLAGGQMLKLPSKQLRRKKISAASKVNRSANVATYRWQAQSPWHASYCANLLVNGYYAATGTSSADGAASTGRTWPMILYDLTCAPNYLGKINDGSAVGPDSRFDVTNVPCAFRMTGDVNTNQNSGDWCRNVRTLNVFTTKDFSVNPSGIRTDNRWELEYLKKPLKKLMGSNPGVTTDWENVQAGIPNYGINESDAQQIYLPPVGARPIHRRTEIQLTLQGADNSYTEYDVMVFRLARGNDHLHPWRDQELLNFTSGVTNETYKTFNYTGVSTTSLLNSTSNASGQGMQADANERVMFWNAVAGEVADNWNIVDRKLISSKLVPIKRQKVIIPPKTSIDKDSVGNCRTVQFKLDWNKVRNYAWQKNDITSMNPTTEVTENATFLIDNIAGPGFATTLNDRQTVMPIVDAEQRVYLMIRAKLPIQYSLPMDWSDAYTSWQDILGNGNFKTDTGGTGEFFTPTQLGKAATYDIVIRNTFELDD